MPGARFREYPANRRARRVKTAGWTWRSPRSITTSAGSERAALAAGERSRKYLSRQDRGAGTADALQRRAGVAWGRRGGVVSIDYIALPLDCLDLNFASSNR